MLLSGWFASSSTGASVLYFPRIHRQRPLDQIFRAATVFTRVTCVSGSTLLLLLSALLLLLARNFCRCRSSWRRFFSCRCCSFFCLVDICRTRKSYGCSKVNKRTLKPDLEGQRRRQILEHSCWKRNWGKECSKVMSST